MAAQEYTDKQRIRIGRKMSYCLRHHPEEYGLSLDDEGFAPLDKFLKALNAKHNFQPKLTKERVLWIMEHSDKQRYEIRGNKIRALYGHSVPVLIEHEPEVPPDVLFHGTARRNLDSILEDGLLPMDRQYVHMSVDIETAINVGSRHDSKPVILRVDAKQAYADGIEFYCGNDKTWLCRKLPAKYLSVETYIQ